MARPPGTGRKKINMEKIGNKNHLKVAFTKRRKGLFKKAAELSDCFGVHIGVFTFSPYGRPYSFANPSEIDVINAFYGRDGGSEGKVEDEDECGGFWWKMSADDMSTEVIESFRVSIMELKKKLVYQIEDMKARREAELNLFV